MNPWPAYINERLAMWDRLKKEYDDKLQSATPKDIKVTLPDGKVVDGLSFRSTPYDIAKSIRLAP